MATAWRSVITRRRAGGDPARPSWIGSNAAPTVSVHRVPMHDLAARPPRRLKYSASVARTEVNRLPGTRTLAATLFVPLDGAVESPEKRRLPLWSEERQQCEFAQTLAWDRLPSG